MAPVQVLGLKAVTFITGGKSRGSEEWNMSMYIIRVFVDTYSRRGHG